MSRFAYAFALFVCGITGALAQSLDPAAIRAAAAYSNAHGGLSFLALQNGRAVSATAADQPFRIFSGTKAFWNLAALAAAEDGLLRLDERVAESIPGWRTDPRKARVTILELLDFSAGLEPVFRLHSDDPGDRDAIAIRAAMVAEPGRAFIYGPSALQVFHAVLKAKLHGETPRHYLERRVLRKIGLGPQRYLLDRAGNPLLAAGWELTARQWAKLGTLVLRDGAPVVAESSLAQSWRGSPANRAFSLGWWNNRAAPGGREFDFGQMLERPWPAQNWSRACLCRAAPNDLVACIGSRYQRLYVIPSLQLVVVRNGNGRTFSDAQFLRLLLAR
ncbi:MAG: beta-lactamase family protein [Verrucomicrobiota bacterium]|nr:beta-lactamase family protein [Verrucomicrobiota bacterium]